MIKVDIDFRNATKEEIDAFYAIPGLEAAISHLQTHNRQYNTVLTVIQPNDQIVEVKVLIMEFMRKHKMEAGHVIPTKPFQFQFYMNLNPKQQSLVEPALEALVAENVLENNGSQFRLTEIGFGVLY